MTAAIAFSALTAGDEYIHEAPADAGPGWRESYYFGFFDPRVGIGGFESFGYRPQKRHSGSMMTLWRPGEVIAALEFGGALDDRARYAVGGVEAACVEPFRRWNLVYQGTLWRRAGVPLRQSVEELPKLPDTTQVEVELRAAFASPGWIGHYRPQPTYRHIFSGCYEQVGRLVGTLRIGDATFELDCATIRHHAWGERDWFRDDAWNWCTCVLDDGSATGFWYRRAGRDEEVNGWLHLDGTTRPIVGVERHITTDPADPKPLPRSASYRIADDAGRSLEITGTVLQIAPAFFRPGDGRPLLHWNDRSLAGFSSSRGQGYGEIEFIDVLPA